MGQRRKLSATCQELPPSEAVPGVPLTLLHASPGWRVPPCCLRGPCEHSSCLGASGTPTSPGRTSCPQRQGILVSDWLWSRQAPHVREG